jgi:4-aminobutyrate aminotransferase/(S)-3-amino-2-methylpropionate transaminase
VLTAGTSGNVLRFLPPLVIPDHLLDEGLDILADAFPPSDRENPGDMTR